MSRTLWPPPVPGDEQGFKLLLPVRLSPRVLEGKVCPWLAVWAGQATSKLCHKADGPDGLPDPSGTTLCLFQGTGHCEVVERTGSRLTWIRTSCMTLAALLKHSASLASPLIIGWL